MSDQDLKKFVGGLTLDKKWMLWTGMLNFDKEATNIVGKFNVHTTCSDDTKSV